MRGWRCSQCGTDHLEPETNLFRYNSPLGACPRCEGSGRGIELDLGRIVPDRSKSIRDGAIAPWSTPAYERLLQELAAIVQQAWRPDRRAIQSAHAEQVAAVIEGQPDAGFPGRAGFLARLERKRLEDARPGLPQPVEALPALPGLPRASASPRGAGGSHWWAQYRRTVGHVDP